MTLISCSGIKKSYGEVDVLKNINLDINEGDRIGLVGWNGAGKTTLANIIFGNLKYDEGRITFYKKNIKIGYLLQSTSYTLNTFNDMIHKNNSKDSMEEFFEISSYLGLKKIKEWDRERFNGLSGGEKTKLMLANIWASKPDVLILDEPTNHMDFEGIQWLIKEVQKYKGTVLIISHDRYFLDKSVKRIVEIDDGVINDYAGNYSFYRDEKKRRYESQLHQYNVQEKYKQKIEEDIKVLEGWSSKAHNGAREKAVVNGCKKGGKEFYRSKAKKKDKQVKSKIKRLQKIEVEGVKKPKEEQNIYFSFDDSQKRGKRLLEVLNITKKYGERTLFKDTSFFIQRGERLGLIGPNGCGKTTLLNIILGNENVSEGNVWVSPSAKIAYLSQDVLDLNEDKTVLQALDSLEGEKRTKAQTLLANMGFDKNMISKQIKYLSLGERTRIKVAYLILQENDFIILDEPTNHLDLHSRERLEETLAQYNGTILIVSHDRYFLERICEKLLIFENNSIQKFQKGFKEYMDKRINKKNSCDNMQKNKLQEKMLIENRIVFVLGELSKYSPKDTEYEKLDLEFNELIKKKKELSV